MNLKILFLSFFAALTLINPCYARDGEEHLNLHNVGYHGDHGEYFDPADKPELYYNRGDQEIILADGFASYYDVYIISMSTMSSVLYERIDGYGDTIDVSSLPNDNDVITLDPPVNVSFEGTFSVYTHQ